MSGYSGSIAYGRQVIAYHVAYAGRKTMEIAVHPDGRVAITAPHGTTHDEVRKRMERRAGWIRKQINYFRRYVPRTPPRRYVGGETHLFLGRQYRLKIEKAPKQEVKLKGAFFYVMTPLPRNKKAVKSLLDAWYQDHAREVFMKRLRQCHEAVRSLNVQLPRIRVKKMAKRWGSCGKGGEILLNAELVRAPLYCIDYVIMHELCHLREHSHNDGYYKLLSKYLPDWERRKERLEQVLL